MPPREGLQYGDHLPHRWASSELVQGRRDHGRGDKDAIVPMDMVATASNGHGALKAGTQTCLFGLRAARDHSCELQQRAAGGWCREKDAVSQRAGAVSPGSTLVFWASLYQHNSPRRGAIFEALVEKRKSFSSFVSQAHRKCAVFHFVLDCKKPLDKRARGKKLDHGGGRRVDFLVTLQVLLTVLPPLRAFNDGLVGLRRGELPILH